MIAVATILNFMHLTGSNNARVHVVWIDSVYPKTKLGSRSCFFGNMISYVKFRLNTKLNL